jgi:hypothetical protein
VSFVFRTSRKYSCVAGQSLDTRFSSFQLSISRSRGRLVRNDVRRLFSFLVMLTVVNRIARIRCSMLSLGNYEVSYKPNAVISSEGSILWIPPAIFKLTCVSSFEFGSLTFVDFRRSMWNFFHSVRAEVVSLLRHPSMFPLDEQKCELRFGPSGLSASQIRFGWYATENSMELSDYVPSGTWSLIEAPAEIRLIPSSEPPHSVRTEMIFFMGKIRLFVTY